MRHLWSLLAGIVVAPLAWLGLATGQHRSARTIELWYEARAFDTAELIGPVAFLAVVGLILGLLGTLRVSPVGPAVAGLLLVTPTVFLFRDPFQTLDAFSINEPWRLLGQDLQPWLPVQNGTLLVLGALLLVAVASTSRWRRWPAPAAAVPATAPAPVPTTPPAANPAAPTSPAAPGPTAPEPTATEPTATEPTASTTAPDERPPLPPVTTRPVPEPEPASRPVPDQRAWSDDEILAAARELDEDKSAARPAEPPADTEPAQTEPPERRP